MTTGALIFAYNNESIDYVGMAAWSAQNIRRHLGIPVAVVTDAETISAGFDRVIYHHGRSQHQRNFADAGTVTWHNTNRVDAYDISPWDQTLVLDADYVVASDCLARVLETDRDFLSFRWAYDITGENDFSGLNYFGDNRMPMWWATVMMFRRSDRSQAIFKSMNMVRDHWRHYRHIYKNNKSVYRNDHALSIALGIVDGHWPDHDSIPWALATLTPEHRLTQLDTDRYRIDFVNQNNQPRWLEILEQDFHAMGKKHLGDIIARAA